MQRGARSHRKSPPPLNMPSNGYPSSPRGYDIKIEGDSSYGHGADYAHRGGYGLSDHRDRNINPSQYHNGFDVPEPRPGRNDVRLPGIGALHEQLRQDNERLAISSYAPARVPENQNSHCMDAQSENSRIYTDALSNREKFRCAPRKDSSQWPSSESRTQEQPKF